MPDTWSRLTHLGRRLTRQEDREMPFWDHLEELRKVLLRAIAGLLVCVLAAYVFSGRIMEEVVRRTIGEATFLRPMEAFNARLKVAFLVGLIGALPFLLWQIWGFVVPGLLNKERRIVAPLVIWSTILFYAGVAFSYLVLTPTMLNILIGFGTEHIRPQIAVGFLLDFIINMALASGLMFQLPLVVAILSLVGVLSPSFLIKRWRHAVVGIFVLTAAVTPGDGPSQLVLAAPVLALYFASIFVAKATWREKRVKTEGETK